jgi:NAD(P)-dependent dehydrogenase (short-subunit alcohol dehydrogenase family)
MHTFEGRTAVVTGAGSGLGLALAKACLAIDMNVVLADIDSAALETAVATMPAARVLAVPTDVSEARSVATLEEQARRRFGAIHLLANNAGVAPMGSLEESTLADWQWGLGVNLMGVVHGLKAFLPGMRAHGETAHVLNTASVAGLIAPGGMAVYNTTKHAVVALSETLLHELQHDGVPIGVSVLCPAWFPSRLAEGDRVRPEALHNPEPVGSARKAAEDRLAIAAASGRLSAGDIAAIALEGIAADRFIILPHKRISAAIAGRFADIIADTHPRDPMAPTAPPHTAG